MCLTPLADMGMMVAGRNNRKGEPIMREIHGVTSEGPVTLTQYADGDAVLHNVESGDALEISAGDLAKVGRLALAAHVEAGHLRNPNNFGRMKPAKSDAKATT